MRLRAIRCNSSKNIELLKEVREVLANILLCAVKAMYKECRYFKRR